MTAPASQRSSRVALVARALLAVALVALLGVSMRANADNSILHEFIPPDPGEDVTFATTTIEGDLPSAIQTPSGIATAPDPRKAPGDRTYQGATTDDSPDSTYEPDRDTRRPKIENYDDPFSPATAPFKRLRAYDKVEADYALRVVDKKLTAIQPGGVLGVGDEPFYGDMSVDLLPDEPVRIPTVGPGARILRMHVNPEIPVTVLRDGADNWFLRGNQRTRVRLVVEIAIPRATFGSDFADVDAADLQRLIPPQPASHEAAATEVLQSIGVNRSMRPREIVKRLVTYYRSFAPSEDKPTGRGDIFLDLALSKKGVCRHRSFAFLVTALHVGIPARMVVNEAHAWVEIFDGTLWHRVDLGGAAANLEQREDTAKPSYVPPPDPYSWPETHDSGQDLADRSRSSNGQGPGNNASPTGSSSPDGSPSPSGSGAANGAQLAPPGASGKPVDPGTLSEVTVSAIDSDARRGLPLHVQGAISSAGVPCPHLRVDVMLSSATSQPVALGSLSTDDRGVYDGAVVIPRDFPIGDYDLVVLTPGDQRCGPGRVK